MMTQASRPGRCATASEAANIEARVAVARDTHHPGRRERFTGSAPWPDGATPIRRTAARSQSWKRPTTISLAARSQVKRLKRDIPYLLLIIDCILFAAFAPTRHGLHHKAILSSIFGCSTGDA
jgi:hypothetical protein